MELIQITTNAHGVQVVSARDLHEFLQSKQQFADWIKARIDKYALLEGVDFTFHKVMNRKSWSNEYALTLSTAKELAMVENNERGKQARQYFIDCEKSLKSNLPIAVLRQSLDLLESQGKTITDHERRITTLEYRESLLKEAQKEFIENPNSDSEHLEAYHTSPEMKARNKSLAERKEFIRLVHLYANQNGVTFEDAYLIVFDEVRAVLGKDIYRESFNERTLEYLYRQKLMPVVLQIAQELLTNKSKKGGSRC